MVIFFRHCRKAYRNNQKPQNMKGKQHDPHIIPSRQESFYDNLKRLNPPKLIISSPFLRCRQTCKLIMEYYKDSDMSIIISPLIREYNPNYSLVDMDSKSRGPYPIEDIYELDNRVKVFFQKYKNVLSSDQTWIISHSSFIKHFFRVYKGKRVLLRQGDHVKYTCKND